jgi:TolB-like protein/Flp pilus assembly protein TadD
MSFVSELRRRQVFRAVAWYGGFAWLAIEVADTVFPQFDLPEWSVRAVIVAALLGLPLAIALAWSFDLTRAGVRREGSGASRPVALSETGTVWRIPSFWIAVALGVGVTVSAQQTWQRLVFMPAATRPAIAVLPFANLSPDPDNAYFADGLHEEVLVTLSRAGSLRVISRTSVQQFRDAKQSLREIAKALDADLVLEGSVRRSGDDLRMTLQLIDGRSEEHLWSETYDRRFDKALTLQAAVAGQVVKAIGAALTPAERQLLERTAPTVPEAYEAYVHALALANKATTLGEMQVVIELLDQAIELDPHFAPAYALRAKQRIVLGAGLPDDPSWRRGALADIERAIELDPDLPEALVARGLYHTYGSLDPERALIDLTRALSLAPSDADTHWATGMTLRRLGRFDGAIEHYREAARLTPSRYDYSLTLVITLTQLGRSEEAEHERLALVARYPADPMARLLKYFIQFPATGTTAGWREEHARLAPTITDEVFRTAMEQAMLTATGDLVGLVTLRQQSSGEGWGSTPDFDLATTYLALGEESSAEPYLQSVAAAARPDDARSLAEGAVALELLGRSGEALQAAERAVALLPERADAMNGGWVAMLRAWVLIHSRIRSEEGYAELERLLGSFDLQPRWVAVSPHWLLLRDDTRAQQIIRSRFPTG